MARRVGKWTLAGGESFSLGSVGVRDDRLRRVVACAALFFVVAALGCIKSEDRPASSTANRVEGSDLPSGSNAAGESEPDPEPSAPEAVRKGSACVNETSDEWLVVLDEPAELAHAALDAYGRVTQRVSPRLLVLGNLADKCAPELATIEGVLAVATEALPPEVLDRLNDDERLWAAAWAQRRKPKDRPGDGLDWDAEGFEAPGPPETEPLE